MSWTIFRYLAIVSLILMIVGIMACSGPAPTAMPEPELSGLDILKRMEAAIKTANSIEFTIQFQVATAEDAIKGNLKVAAVRPDSLRAEVTSENPAINGLLAVTNATEGWAYSPADKLVLKATTSQYKAQLNEQPELRELLDTGQQITERGFDDKIKAEKLGTAEMNGHQTYKVQVIYDETADPELQLNGVTTVYYIDKETFLPQRIELTVAGEDASASGFVTLTELKTEAKIDPKTFTFEPPAGATVMDLNQMALPTFEMPPQP